MVEFKLPGMHCGGCAARVVRILQGVDPTCRAEVDLAEHRVCVQSLQPRAVLAKALAAAGLTEAA